MELSGIYPSGIRMSKVSSSSTFAWTTNGTLWSISGKTATPSGLAPYGGTNGYGVDVLHGPLLPPGTYVDILVDGFGSITNHYSFLGVTDHYGAFNFGDNFPYIAWYGNGGSGTMYENVLVSMGPAPGPLGKSTPTRYRVVSKAGGVITWSEVSLDGTSFVGSPVTKTMTATYNAANLHLMILPQYGYYTLTATGYDVQQGTGGL